MHCMKVFVILAAVVAGAAVSYAAECSGSPSPDAQPNNNPIITDAPVFVKSVPNGALYTVGSGDDMLPIVHLFGTPYEKGYAHGLLMKDQATGLINQAWEYFEEQVIAAINDTAHKLHIPQDLIDAAANLGLEVALDATVEMTEPFTNPQFYDEMRGLANASGIDFMRIRRVHMIGELTKGSCSMYGAWGNATASLGGKLLQLRALDWDVEGPFRFYPQLTVYHGDGSAEYGNTFANVGWSGWIGLITGISEAQLGVSEIGVYYPDASFGQESREGIPFTNILRDILQFDTTIEEAETRLTNANRTCDLILGVGDGKSRTFRGVQYSHSVANFIDDQHLIPVAEWHPPIDNIVYFGMDWLCPSFNSVLAKQLSAYYGKLTPEISIQYITSIVQTGDLHCAVYNLDDRILYVAVAQGLNESGPMKAYDRTFTRLDMNQLFALQPPSF